MKRIFIACALLVLLLTGVAAFVYHELREPYRAFHGDAYVQIHPGTTTDEMAALLARRGIIEDKWRFLAVRALRHSDVLQAGEYRFRQPASVWQVYGRIAAGDVHYYSFTVPEGTNIFDTAKTIGKLDWVDEQSVLEQVQSPELIRDLDPGASTLEGYLFPSTYRVTRGMTALEILRMMTNQFRRVWRELASDADLHETVTFASLVEKETGLVSERTLVSSVFHNRLRRGMKLECDPTTIYAAILEGRYTGVIRRSDLADTHPYNTYQHAGLPPGPIASPGREALKATLFPGESAFLFFVARPDDSGGHEFSKTLAAHNRAVRRYRSGIRQANSKKPAARVSANEGDGDSN